MAGICGAKVQKISTIQVKSLESDVLAVKHVYAKFCDIKKASGQKSKG